MIWVIYNNSRVLGWDHRHLSANLRLYFVLIWTMRTYTQLFTFNNLYGDADIKWIGLVKVMFTIYMKQRNTSIE